MEVAEQSEVEGIDERYSEVIEHFDRYCGEADRWMEKTGGYHDRVEAIYRAIIPPGSSVLEIGCGRGDLLAALQPSRGVGVDISARMVSAARERHPGLEFTRAAGETVSLGESFDYIVMCDLVPYVQDLQALMATVSAHSHPRTRVVANTYSHLWRGPLRLMRALNLRPDRPTQNWVAPRDLVNLFELGGLEVITLRHEILMPVRSRALSTVVNGLLARLPVMRALTLTTWFVARPAARAASGWGTSVVVPCRNEAGSIDEIAKRVPEMGRETEIIFAEGGSEDDTRQRIEETIAARPDRDMRLIVQTGRGKANAVHEAFGQAKHEVLMILDADMTVAPEDLPKFYEALIAGRGELINGSRLVYGMEPEAMRFLNLVGNRLFASLMTWILGQYVKDTLCGTKALHRDDYLRIMALRDEIAGEDPFGDFEFLIGAALLGLKILNVPVRYGARTYGETNIQRFSGGGMLARLAAGGFRRIWIKPVERVAPAAGELPRPGA